MTTYRDIFGADPPPEAQATQDAKHQVGVQKELQAMNTYKVYATLMGSIDVQAETADAAEKQAREAPMKDFEFQWEFQVECLEIGTTLQADRK